MSLIESGQLQFDVMHVSFHIHKARIAGERQLLAARAARKVGHHGEKRGRNGQDVEPLREPLLLGGGPAEVIAISCPTVKDSWCGECGE